MAEKKDAKKSFKPYKPGKMCPKCNSRMAEHSDRFSCGKCGYSEFKTQHKENSDGKH
ncbi:MAG: 30S ribosomal protein S27ae [Candidatus Micrarchaeales archaeon]|nr:30S ribosomal protein S27ae [Candidatus Micrarchaeales archaeon]